MSEIVHCLHADLQIGIFVECPSCSKQVNVLDAFAEGKKPEDYGAAWRPAITFRELLKCFPSPEPYSTTLICSLDMKCPDCGYAMRITSLELEVG